MPATDRRPSLPALLRSPARTRRRRHLSAEGLETRNLLSTMMYQYESVRTPAGIVGPLARGAAASVGGYGPADITQAYGFNAISFTDAQRHAVPGDGRGMTIAIVDAFDAPNIASDLQTFDQQFGLPAPPSFQKVDQRGGNNLPREDDGWSGEIALDVEWAHAVAPAANILLVEADTNDDPNMWAAVDYARSQPGVVAVSMSWGEPEYDGQSAVDAHMVTPAGHGGVTFLAASGDDGGQPITPSTSPNAVGVGGTSLDTGGGYLTEEGWSGSGGGVSAYNAQPSYQNGVVSAWSTTMRTGPDVSYNADPWYGFAVYNTSDYSGWNVYGGTSAGTPQWAALVAIADQGRALKGLGSLDGASQTLPALYQMSPSDFNDITFGYNNQYYCTAGYDLVTGLGSPQAASVVNDLVLAGTYGSPFTVSPKPLSLGEGNAFSGTVASIRDTYLTDTAGSITATINWGDGTSTTGTVVATGGTGYDVDGSHTYALPGQYTITVSAARAGGDTATSTGTAVVSDAPLSANAISALSAWEGRSMTGEVGWFTDGDPNSKAADFTVVINWGDGTTSAGQVTTQGNGYYQVNGTHTYADEGTYTDQVTIKDVGGNTASVTGSVSVSDGVLASSAGSVSPTRNKAFTGTVATFLDYDTAATATDFTVTINWGDGKTSVGKVKSLGVSNGYARFAVTGTHTYTNSGRFSYSVLVSDDGGTSSTATGTVNVKAASITANEALTATALPDATDSLSVLDSALAGLGRVSRRPSGSFPS